MQHHNLNQFLLLCLPKHVIQRSLPIFHLLTNFHPLWAGQVRCIHYYPFAKKIIPRYLRNNINLILMEFITPYIILNSKSHIAWGLLHFETTLITIIKEDPIFGRT